MDITSPPQTLLLSVPEAAAQLRVSRRLVYELLAGGELRSVRIGGRRLVSAAALGDYVAQLDSDQNKAC